MPTIQENLTTLKTAIRTYEQKYNRRENSVHLLAVSKGQPIAHLQEAIAAGQENFGENYLNEALEKIFFFAGQNLKWHFIGPLQSNKTKKIAEHFSWVHSVANTACAQRLNDQRPANLPPLNICLQVNISDEATKSGIAPEETEKLAAFCLSLPRLRLRGLMTIPAPQQNFLAQRQTFHELHRLLKQLQEKNFPLDTLSMGMSDDFEAAIAEGSTWVRIGSALFGKRI